MIDFVQYTAIMESVYEKHSLGQAPPEEWLAQIEWAQNTHPEWVVVPPPPPVATNGTNGHNGANSYSNGFVVPPPPPPPSSPPRAAIVTNKGERPDIVVGENMEEVSRNVLAWWGTRYCVFQAGGRLLEVQTDKGKDVAFLAREPDSPRMVAVGSARARTLASRECNFVKEKTGKDGKEENISILPPEWLGPSITTRTDFPGVPVFAALAQAPTLRRDGALISECGYDPSTGIYLESYLQVSVPTTPTLRDAEQALYRLMDLMADFEFVNHAGKTVWLAALLSVTCRHTYNGPTPIFIFDASKKGAGKSRLADMISIIATGQKAARMVYSTNDEEMDKRITSLGLAGEQLVLIDNIKNKLASPSLDAALTSDTYRGRILGKTEMTPSIPMKVVWLATGNGMIIGADTSRRALLTRIEPSVANPETRTGPRPGSVWRHERIIEYVTINRGELLSCALTIVSAFIHAGRPNEQHNETGAIGSFEEWSDTIRAAITWAGGIDPCEVLKDTRAADVEELAVQTMIDCWPVNDNVSVTTTALIKQAETAFGEQASPSREQWRNALLEWLPAKSGAPLPTARDLGYALRSIKGSIIGDYKIIAGEPTMNGVPWMRVRAVQKNQEISQISQFPRPNMVIV